MGSKLHSTILIVFATLSLALSASIVGSPFIFGGERAKENQFPYLVSLRVLRDGEFKHECGAAIISDRYILTAAHCYSPEINSEGYRISIAAHTLDESGIQYEVKRFILHPEYDSVAKANDIALIQTKDFIQFNKTISVIRVNPEFIDGHDKAIIAGWGDSDVSMLFLVFFNIHSEDLTIRIFRMVIKD